MRILLRNYKVLLAIASGFLGIGYLGVDVMGWEQSWAFWVGLCILILGVFCAGAVAFYAYVLYKRGKMGVDDEGKINYVDKIIIDSKAEALLAIPEALQALSDLDIELTNRLSLIKRSNSKLKSIQNQLRKDWKMRPSETYDNLSEKIIKDAINQTTKRMKLSYTSVNEETMIFMMHVAGVLDDNNTGLSKPRENDERYNLVNRLKTKVATQELKNAIRVYTWYSLGINSILLLIAYFPVESVRSMMKMLGKTPTELKAEREQTLSFLLTDVNKLLEGELHGKRK